MSICEASRYLLESSNFSYTNKPPFINYIQTFLVITNSW